MPLTRDPDASRFPAIGRLRKRARRLAVRTAARTRRLAVRSAARVRRWSRGGRPSGAWLSRAAIVAAALLLALLIAWERCLPGRWCPDLEVLEAYRPAGAPVLLDRRGEEIATLHPLQQRVVPLDSLPPHLPAAFVAVEDRRFFEHGGVDWLRVPAAALEGQGGSTITMQLARSLFPDLLPRNERTIRRKLQEIRVARQIERAYAKREILEFYLNHVYLGGGTSGVEEASHHFFGRSARTLSAGQAALLAAMARAPANYDPRRHPERARDRRDLVLSLMEAQNRLTSEQATGARGRPLDVVATPPPRLGSHAPYFVEEVRGWLAERFSEALLRTPARIHTTLDLRVQVIAEQSLLEQLGRIEDGAYGELAPSPEGREDPLPDSGSAELQGAVVVLDPHDGDVLALVGGRDFGRSTYNRASRASRQVGSAFKPFVYAAALSEGFLQSQPIADVPFEVTLVDSAPWSPGNYDGRYRGHVNMREALVHSMNVPTARLAMAVGVDHVVEYARAAGIEGALPASPSLALGSATLTPLELAAAYATLAAVGPRVRPRLVSRIEGPDGEVLHLEAVQSEAGLDPRVAFIVGDMLREVVDRGTGAEVRRAGFEGVAAGKTGTTQDGRDAWFAGYTPDLVATIWIGYDRPRTIVSGGTGGTLAAPAWGRMMRRIYDERDASEAWPIPEGVIETAVDPLSGMYVEDGCSAAGNGPIRVLFLEEHQPAATCPMERGWLDRLGSFLGLASDEDPGLPLPERSDAFTLDAPVERILGATVVPGR